MIRRSFRLGLRLGLLAGVLIGVAKVVQSRRSSREEAWGPGASGGEAWPPVQAEPVAPEPPVATVPERLAPMKKATTDPGLSSSPSSPPAPTRTGATDAVPGSPVPAMPAEAPPVPSATRPAAPTPPCAAPPPAAPPPPPAPPAPPIVPPAARPAAPAVPAVPPPATVSSPVVNPGRPTPPADPPPAATNEPEAAEATATELEPPVAPVPTRRVRKAGTRRVTTPHPSWVESADGQCPESHPVKAKLASMLYHLPGMAAYNRTRPDRCYNDAASAEADGFIRAKR